MKLLGIGSRIEHPEHGVGVVVNAFTSNYKVIFVDTGEKKVPFDDAFKIIEFVEKDDDTVSFFEVEQSLKRILEKWNGQTENVPLGERWKGGTMILKPKSDDLAIKEVPIEIFFHKIVMMRDKLRVLEQRVNSSALLDEEKVDIQQYITRCYGTMTTFNVLFKEKDHQFSSK